MEDVFEGLFAFYLLYHQDVLHFFHRIFNFLFSNTLLILLYIFIKILFIVAALFLLLI